MRKVLIPVAVTAAAAGGAAALWLGPAFASAQTTSSTTPATTSPAPPKDGPLERALAKLVADGTLTQAQADKVLTTLKAELPARPDGPGFGFGHHGPGPIIGGLRAAQAYLGVTDAELRTALESGKTLAQVAQSKGKSVSGLIDAMVKDAKDHLATEVTEGDLTQARADQMATDIKAKVTDLVNNGIGAGKGFEMRGFGHGPGPWGPPPPASSGSGSTAA
jgi:hypothetical protein